ncbi:MAG: nucleotidyltransferase family protein [Spirochaetia bacterium]
MHFNAERYASGLRRANEIERNTTLERAKVAREAAVRLAERIAAADEGVSRIYLFGSLLSHTPSNPDFDIDLAVEGGDILAATGAGEEADFKVDVLALDRLPTHVQERIRREGRVLFSR